MTFKSNYDVIFFSVTLFYIKCNMCICRRVFRYVYEFYIGVWIYDAIPTHAHAHVPGMTYYIYICIYMTTIYTRPIAIGHHTVVVRPACPTSWTYNNTRVYRITIKKCTHTQHIIPTLLNKTKNTEQNAIR